MAIEYPEYVASVVANASEMITAIDMTKNELLEMLGDEHQGSIVQIAKEMKDEVIVEAYRASMAPFMPRADDEELDRAGDGDEEEASDDEAVAGSGDAGGVRGERR
jgi:hypothetical protein